MTDLRAHAGPNGTTGMSRAGVVTRLASVVAVIAATFGVAIAGAPPAAAATPAITSVAAGWDHSCALTATGGVKCWGANEVGQLGDGTTTDRTTPVTVVGLASGVVAIAAGGNHTCALTSAGGVKCWGGNAFAGLGDGTLTDRSVPVDVSGLSSGATAIALGAFHTCAIVGSGMKCWGLNEYGGLGDGTTITRATPVDVVGLTGVATITAGGRHTCAVTSTGGAKCWGHAQYGQLGDEYGVNRYTPYDVVNLSSGVSSISAGGRQTCVVTTAGGAKCWGRNDFGQVGDGTLTDRFHPVDVSGLTSGVSAVSGGRWFSCAVLSSGGVKCWGPPDGEGEVDDPRQPEPQDIAGLSGVTALATGDGHSCAVLSTGGVKCFGNNFFGELGDGTTTGTMTPVDVLFGELVTTSTTVSSSLNPSRFGDTVTFTATVAPASGSETPTGTVTFKDGTATLGTATLSGGSASFATPSLAAGTHEVTAVYSGDANFDGSTSSAVTQTVRIPALAINNVVVAEGNAGTTSATFTVTLSEPSATKVTVRATTVDGTATAPGDYEAGSFAVKFLPGETSKSVVVNLQGDTVVEPNETFTVRLSKAVNARFADRSGRATIQNDD